MGIFNFVLKKVDQCALPGETRKSMAWFWITDSLFHISLGDVALFEASAGWQEKYKMDSPYMDYPYARLLEDLFDLFPEVSQGIPGDVFSLIDTAGKHQQLEDDLNQWYLGIEEPTEEQDNIFERISRFLGFARLDTGYLRYKSRCYFYHVGDRMVIRYDFRDEDEDGCPVWSAGSGEYIIPYRDFINETDDLLTRFFNEMDIQVDQAAALLDSGLLYDAYEAFGERDRKKGVVKTPAGYLLQEHHTRKEYFWGLLNRLKDGDFNEEADWNRLKDQIHDLQAQMHQ